ncbi:hypothetical protein C0J52_22776 [Blattella germanica]|nr:hypothetical protein C0J52_22776 [Blattella germanica]
MFLRSKLLLSYISPEIYVLCPTVSAKIPSLPFPLYKICVINFTSLLSNSKRPRNVCFSIWDIHQNKFIPIFNIIDHHFYELLSSTSSCNPNYHYHFH